MKQRTRSTNSIHLASLLAVLCFALSTANASALTGRMSNEAVSNLQIPFNHTASVTLGDTSELVDFTGRIHVVVVVTFPTDPVLPPSPIRIHTNVMDVSGVGQTSGLTYRLNGTGDFEFALSRELSFVTGYRLIPSPPPISEGPSPPPIRNFSFSVGYLLSLNTDGQVTGVEAFPTIIEE